MREWIQGGAGALLFAAALTLSLPGVSVHADPTSAGAPSASSHEPAMCRADAPLAELEVVLGTEEALRRQAEADSEANAAEGIRVLNGAGYNYNTTRKVDFRALEREIRLHRARTH